MYKIKLTENHIAILHVIINSHEKSHTPKNIKIRTEHGIPVTDCMEKSSLIRFTNVKDIDEYLTDLISIGFIISVMDNKYEFYYVTEFAYHLFNSIYDYSFKNIKHKLHNQINSLGRY